MIRRKLLIATLAGVIASGAIGGSVAAYAKNNEQATDEAAIMANAKITMTQAIAAAEQQVGGKAVGTGIEDQDGTVYFEVQVLKNGARQKVLVVHHSDFDVLIPSHWRIGKLSGGTRISMLLGIPG